MSKLFKSSRHPDPEPPATMPDPNDPLQTRFHRKDLRRTSSLTKDRLAPVPGTIGREYSRSTLGTG